MADRLESWKQIAGHLGRDVRTVQRWEKREGLPVHRHAQDSISSVYADTSELDKWWGQRGGQVEIPAVPQARPNHWYMWIGALAVAAAVGGWAVYRPSRVPEVARTRPLTTYPGTEFDPTFSPDGSQVAFSWNGRGEDNFDIYVKSLDAADPHRLTSDPAEDCYPAWSPSGRWIAFMRALGSDRAGIFLVPPSGGAERKVGEVAWPDSRVKRMPATWSADEQYLFVSDRESSSERLALFVLNLATSEKRRLTNPPAESYGDADAALSPDGRSLAFVRSRGFVLGTLEVLPLREGPIANGEPKAIVSAMEPLGSPTWTPDGTAIVFHSGLVESRQLWRVAASGKSRPEALAVSGSSVSEPALSRDGRQLVYVKQSLDTNIWRLSVAQPGGSPKGMSRVIDSTAMDLSPHLSADGRKVAFVSMRSGAYGIWISEADGSRPAQITSLVGAIGSPHWSPDGIELAFDSAASGRSQIYLVSAAGGIARRIESRYHDCAPSFSHDGRFLYFGSNRSGSFQVWRRPRNGGEPVPVTRGGGHGALDSPDGRYLYYTKEHSLVSCSLWRIPLKGGEENQVVDLVASRAFAVGNTGIYYITQSGRLPALRWRSHDGRQDQLVLQMDKALGGTGIAISPDEKEVLFTVVDRIESDLMLWEHFR